MRCRKKRCRKLCGKNRVQGFFLISIILCFVLAVSVTVRAEGLIISDDSQKKGGFITIDANKKYEGMNAPFSRGYEPSVEKNTMTLVVPFMMKQETEQDRIVVGISFEREENSHFYYKNYQKKVKKSEDGIYLYRCRIQLKEDRVNGQYPLRLWVQAETSEERLQQEFNIYVEITDGIPKVSEENPPEENSDFTMENQVPDSVLPDAGEESGQPAGGSGSGEQIIHQPRVMITDNSLQTASLEAGTQALWSLSARNCSRSYAMENVKVTMTCENRDIIFEKTSWYFDWAGAGGSMDLSQHVTVGKKAAAESVAVQFQFDYEDKQGTACTSTETVTLSVVQIPQAELTNLSFPDSIYEADTDLLTFQIQNTGLAVIYNVRIRLEGKGLFTEKELFLGTMEAGSSADGEISVFAGNLTMDNEGNVIDEGGKKYGDTTGTVVFSYENEQGEPVETSQELHTAIKKPQVVELKVEKEAPKTNQWWITVLAGIFLVLILIIIWLYLRMKHYWRVSEMHKNSWSGKEKS